MQREQAKPGMRVRYKPTNKGGKKWSEFGTIDRVGGSYAYVIRDGYKYATATAFGKIDPADPPSPPPKTITAAQAARLRSLLEEAKVINDRQQAIIDEGEAVLGKDDWVWEYFLAGDRPLESLLEKIQFTITESDRGEHQEAALAEVPERHAGPEGRLPLGPGDAAQ